MNILGWGISEATALCPRSRQIKPFEGLLINAGIWRELNNFSSGSVCLVIASAVFDEDDYIRDFEEFLKFKKD